MGKRKRMKKLSEYIATAQCSYNKHFQLNIRSLKSKEPKEYWKLLKEYDFNQYNKPDITLTSLYEHFKQLNTAPHERTYNIADKCTVNIEIIPNTEINIRFTKTEVVNCIRTLKNNKSPNAGGIINDCFKHATYRVVNMIMFLFNVILDTE